MRTVGYTMKNISLRAYQYVDVSQGVCWLWKSFLFCSLI